jgi:hypothetical protein
VRSRLAALAVASLFLSGCQATAGVAVSVGRDGAGTVRATTTLDKTAAANVGDLKLRVADLAPTGWQVEQRTTKAGDRVVLASRQFHGAADFGGAMRELGPPFAGFTVTRSRSLFRTRTTVSGAVDLRQGIEAFGDARLTGQLGPGFGLQAADQAALRKALRFEVRLGVPGAHKTWRPTLGSRTPVQLSATAWNTDVLFPALVAMVMAFALALLLLWRRFN